MDTPGPKPSRLETSELVQEIAKQTHLPAETVRLVLDTFLAVAKSALCEGKIVVLRTFGLLQALPFKGVLGEGVRFKFKVAGELKKAAQEVFRPMEKYGVETKTDAALVAQVTGTCPVCKAELETKKPPKCPNCGTEPFENKEPK